MASPSDLWEYGKSVHTGAHALRTYTEEAVMRYRAPSIEALTQDTSKLLALIKHHLTHQVPRLETLERYYLGDNALILNGSRRLEDNKADYRVRHSFAGVVSDFLNTYVLANPVKIEDVAKSEAQSEFINDILDFNIANDIDSHNLEIGKDQNNLGRAYELLVRTTDDRDKIYRLDPREVFMVYDETVATSVIGAVRYYRVNQLDPSHARYRVELYTPTEIVTYGDIALDSIEESGRHLVEMSRQPHRFMGVPIIEYRSDRYRMGVYEKQLPLIDAYDSAQSDTANYMSDFNDAILVIEGLVHNADDPDYMAKAKDSNLMILVPGGDPGEARSAIGAYYLTKSYDVAGVEAYKSRLKEDIYSLSSVPNLSDEAFSGNRSGEALKYKMFGLQQKRADKEKFLAKGFRVRYKLLENVHRSVGRFTGDSPQLSFTFTPNLPEAYLDELTNFVNAGGRVSQRTMLGLLSFVDDPEQEAEFLASEDEDPLTYEAEATPRPTDLEEG